LRKKRKRDGNQAVNTSLPKKIITRTPWASVEKQFIRNTFSKYFNRNSNTLPSLYDIRESIKDHPLLSQRNAAAIKTWIRQNKE